MTIGLADCFRYNLWANQRLLDACAEMSDAQLDAPAMAGTFGTVRQTLLHLFTAEEGYARHYRFTGPAPTPRLADISTFPGFDELRRRAHSSGEELIAVAEQGDLGRILDDEPKTILEHVDMDEQRRINRSGRRDGAGDGRIGPGRAVIAQWIIGTIDGDQIMACDSSEVDPLVAAILFPREDRDGLGVEVLDADVVAAAIGGDGEQLGKIGGRIIDHQGFDGRVVRDRDAVEFRSST